MIAANLANTQVWVATTPIDSVRSANCIFMPAC